MPTNFSNRQKNTAVQTVSGGVKLSKADFVAAQEDLKNLRRDFIEQRTIVVAGFVVLAFTVVGMLFALFAIVADYWRFKGESYESYRFEIMSLRASVENQCEFSKEVKIIK